MYEILNQVVEFILEYFIFYYPLIMSLVWIQGAVFYFFHREIKSDYEELPESDYFPKVSILIPAHNEETALPSTLNAALESVYPDMEIIVINDASTDKTWQIIQQYMARDKRVRGIFMERNAGKAAGLNAALFASTGEIIVTIDADAWLHKNAVAWLVQHFRGPRVGAVTGNPRVRNRTNLISKIQVGEFSSIVGMIKRSQRILGKVLTVSGVIAAFRKQALLDVNLWDSDMATDDINVTWKLEKRFWDIRYEPNALCWILVPDTIKGLFKQRVRWAQGGTEVLLRHKDIWCSYKQRRLWPVYIEYVLSIFWSYCFVIFSIFCLINIFFGLGLPYVQFIPKFKGAFLVVVCMLQFATALLIDMRYEKGMLLQLFWVIWYPFFYWIFTAVAAVWAVPKAFKHRKGKFATWVSPDRG
jgi:biofilm PGA synthesis N-glycosyltransferase PgaC